MFSDLWSLAFLNRYIPVFQRRATTLPRTSPIRIAFIQALAIALNGRYYLLGQVDDLEQSILHYTEAIFLPRHWGGHFPNVAHNLFLIAQLLLFRAVYTVHPEDVKRSVIYLRYLGEQSLEAFYITPDMVREPLVWALTLQVSMGLGDSMQDIEEMASLILELFNSDISTTSTVIIAAFACVAIFRLFDRRGGQEPLGKVIDCLQKAKIRLPLADSDELSLMLASTLFVRSRFQTAYSDDDYKEGTAILDKILTSHLPGDIPTDRPELLQGALVFAAMGASARWQASGRPDHFEEAIYRSRNCLPWIPLGNPFRPILIQHLAMLEYFRFHYFGVGRGQGVNPYDPTIFGLPSFWDLIESVESPSEVTETQHSLALYLAFFTTDTDEIEPAIEVCRRLLDYFPIKFVGTSFAFSQFAYLLLRGFECTNNIEYVDEAITILHEDPNFLDEKGSGILRILIELLSTRFNIRRSREDLDEIVQLYQMVADRRRHIITFRFLNSCEWAELARSHSHPSTSTAYHYAPSLMQDTLTFTPTVDIQHSRLVNMRNDYETLPLDCASYQVQIGQLQSAVETLERGRALIWSEMRGLRSSIDQLRASDSDLADKFAANNHDLEVLTLTLTPNNYGDSEEEGSEGMDPFGRLVVRQRRLSDDRDKLISQIRARKGLESFLDPPSFDNLRSAAVRGPVIMINHSRWRSDIIILLYDSPPSLIPTANDFYDRANKLRHQLLGTRKEGLDSVEYEDALCSVLKELYELVGRPVIRRLNELGIPEQSRVWWCPTSAFCSLPLHAMGPIPSDSDTPRYFLDLYIPSYTPTLSALIESNKSGLQTLGKPSLLLVVQQDASMKAALGETRVVQSVDTQVKTLISARATPPAVLKHLQDHRFVHVVCHGILEPGKPFDSSFKLYRGNRLSLLDIIRSRLPNAEFAFLAACHTAELTDGSLSDEALHLTAAMQYCGFRSVVGTMWAMADKDGPHLTQNFYNSVFPPGESQGACYYERTAEALRDAVINLRGRMAGEEGSLERWVNFVHYGA